jgi:hypothetical protein
MSLRLHFDLTPKSLRFHNGQRKRLNLTREKRKLGNRKGNRKTTHHFRDRIPSAKQSAHMHIRTKRLPNWTPPPTSDACAMHLSVLALCTYICMIVFLSSTTYPSCLDQGGAHPGGWAGAWFFPRHNIIVVLQEAVMKSIGSTLLVWSCHST